MKPLLYADRQVLDILATRPFDLQANGRWTFAEGRSISNDVAQRLVAHGEARVIAGQLFKRPVAHGSRAMQLSDCQRPEGER